MRSVFLLLRLLAWFPTRPCAAQIYSTVPYKPVKNSLVPFVYTCTAYLFFGLYTSTLCEVLCEVPFLSCDLLLCVGDGGGGGGGGVVVCVAAGSGTTPEPRRATPLNNHTQSIRHEKYEHSTELSRHLWTLKREGKAYDIDWSIHKRASAFSNASRKCQLCIAEKVAIITAEKESTLNKKSELVSKCRHENKFYLSNFVA